jgi:hypothetical protein
MTTLISLALTGCVADVKLELDADEDGLLDSEEAALGSDPSNPDSDGDNYNDGAEAAANTSPTDAEDHPYKNGWQIDACRHDITATGESEGEVADDFALVDQFGETVHLHDFCNQVVYMVFAAFW